MLRAKGFGLVSNPQPLDPILSADHKLEPVPPAAAVLAVTESKSSWEQLSAARSRPSSGGSWSEQLEKAAAVKNRPLSGGSWSEQLEKAARARPEIGPPVLINTTLGPLALENHKCISVAGEKQLFSLILHCASY